MCKVNNLQQKTKSLKCVGVTKNSNRSMKKSSLPTLLSCCSNGKQGYKLLSELYISIVLKATALFSEHYKNILPADRLLCFLNTACKHKCRYVAGVREPLGMRSSTQGCFGKSINQCCHPGLINSTVGSVSSSCRISWEVSSETRQSTHCSQGNASHQHCWVLPFCL